MGKTSQQKRARRLQQQTGWSYSECLRCVRTMTEDQIDNLIELRARRELEKRAVAEAMQRVVDEKAAAIRPDLSPPKFRIE